MATIPLYDTTATAPGAWRHVTAPGGYQWWRVDALNRTTDDVITIVWHEGCQRDARYFKDAQRFFSSPTRISPPTPDAYRAIELARYASSLIDLRFERMPSFTASGDRIDIDAGRYRVAPKDNGYLITAPFTNLTLSPIGVDGSLWSIRGEFSNNSAVEAIGTLHTAFDTEPDRSSFRYVALLNDRAMTGTADDESEILNRWSLKKKRRLERGRSLYSSVADGVRVIVDQPALLRRKI